MAQVTLDDAAIAYGQYDPFPRLLPSSITLRRRLNRNFNLAGIIVLVYDHMLTFDSEVKYIWKAKRKRPSLVFLFIRYSALVIRLFALVTFDFGDYDADEGDRCKRLNSARSYLTVIQELFVGLTLALRVLAMYAFDKRVLGTLVTTAILCVVASVWCVFTTGAPLIFPRPISGCLTAISHSSQVREAGAWEALLAADVVLLGLTITRAYNRSRDIPTGALWRVLIRDGVICLANVANIVTFIYGNVITANSLPGFTAKLSVTMICRLMLNLHEAAAITDPSLEPKTTGIVFAHTEGEESDGVVSR
ncbi:hypothetical protein GGX14DRAFT_698042 [Mycena pura]|uniref:DUF6533 domain-containing protein n=1 Tax=Mycena pura TaxID=153505 RepID=A0AAD6YGC3_9AGAR|nr:hypothetical protein GGX14DRAFT_698042 [Mycena pura]